MSPNLRPLQRACPWALALAVVLPAHVLLLRPKPAAPLRAPPVLQASLRLLPALAPASVPALAPARLAAAPSRKSAPHPVSSTKEQAPAAAPALPIAPSVEWIYKLRQNGREGRASLHWQVENGVYHLQLDRQLGEKALPAWRSTGRVGTDGIAPSRYAELRGAREARATNFRREEGLISYSASSELVPLTDATQDPISWWLQLAALASAEKLQPGREIHLPVVGLRGEPLDWVFEVIDTEQGWIHLRRPNLTDWDGPLDVWLDPAHHHLPVRLRSGDPETRGWTLEFAHPASTD